MTPAGEPRDNARDEGRPPHAATGLKRFLLIALAVVSLALAVLGVVLPGLPTTPFVLLAAWAAARSSPRLAAWLEAHRLFGPMIRDWRAGGRVSRRAKWSATIAMAACAVILAWITPRLWVFALASACMALTLVWLWRRPEPDAMR